MNIGSLTIEMSANVARLTQDMNQAKSIVTSATQSIADAANFAKGALLGMVSIGSVMAFKGMIDSVILTKVELQRLSIQTGASVESLSAISAVSKMTGTDIGAVGAAMNKLSKNLATSNEDSKGAATALKALGLSFSDFKNLSADEQLLQVAKAMDKFQDGGGKAAGAMLLFGKSGAQLLPMLAELAQKNELVGKTTTASALQAVAYEKNIRQLEAAGNAWKRQLTDDMLPALVAVTKAMADARKQGQGLLGSLGAGIATLITGNDQYKNDVALTEQTYKLVEAENKLYRLRIDKSRTAELEVPAQLKRIEGIKAEIATTMAYRKVLSDADDAQAKSEKARADERKKNGGLNIAVPASGGAGAADDPTKKILDGELKRLEEFVAAEKTQLQTRSQYLDFYRGLEYFNLRETEEKKQALIADNLRVAQAAYDKEVAAITAYVAQAAKEVDKQDGLNKIAEAKKKRAAAEIEANKQIGDSLNTLLAIQRQFDLGTIERARQDKIANDSAQFQIDMLGKHTLEVLKATEARRIQLALDERIYQLKKQDPNADTSGAIAQAATQTAIATAKIQESYQKQRDAVFGADEAVRKYLEDITNEAAQMERLFTDAFKGMEDALVNFVKTGKLDFKSLADSIITQLIRIQIQESITKPLGEMVKSSGGAAGIFGGIKSMFGFADGGIMSAAGSMPLNKYAGGGVANSPQFAMFGEGSTPEAYVPLPDGRSIPVTMSGAAGGGDVTINQPLIINANNASAETVGQIRALMPGFIAENKRVVEAVVQQALARRGGRLAA